jgi:hypothetical protein
MTDTPIDRAAAKIADQLTNKLTMITAGGLDGHLILRRSAISEVDSADSWDDECEAVAFKDAIDAIDAVIAIATTDELAILLTERAEMKARIAALEGHLNKIFSHFDADIWGCSTENAPGHGHQSPGIWDDDSSNGDNAGKPCGWCAQWNTARQALASGLTKRQEEQDGFRMQMGVKNG